MRNGKYNEKLRCPYKHGTGSVSWHLDPWFSDAKDHDKGFGNVKTWSGASNRKVVTSSVEGCGSNQESPRDFQSFCDRTCGNNLKCMLNVTVVMAKSFQITK